MITFKLDEKNEMSKLTYEEGRQLFNNFPFEVRRVCDNLQHYLILDTETNQLYIQSDYAYYVSDDRLSIYGTFYNEFICEFKARMYREKKLAKWSNNKYIIVPLGVMLDDFETLPNFVMLKYKFQSKDRECEKSIDKLIRKYANKVDKRRLIDLMPVVIDDYSPMIEDYIEGTLKDLIDKGGWYHG